jgi:hypothetical protein
LKPCRGGRLHPSAERAEGKRALIRRLQLREGVAGGRGHYNEAISSAAAATQDELRGTLAPGVERARALFPEESSRTFARGRRGKRIVRADEFRDRAVIHLLFDLRGRSLLNGRRATAKLDASWFPHSDLGFRDTKLPQAFSVLAAGAPAARCS